MSDKKIGTNTNMADPIKQTQGVKLNLGCSIRKFHGWTNIDARQEVFPDIIDNVFILESVEDSSVDLIYASHLLEHVKRKEVKSVLLRWKELLRPNGVLRLSVPDFEKVIKYYLLTADLEKLHGLLHGGQRNEYDIHYITFDFKLLKRLLTEVGFAEEDIRIYSFKETEHFFIDDGSQAHLPHMDKTNGMLMSLNVEAIKR